MKLMTVLSVLLIICSACDNEDNFNEELLIGNWKLQQTSYPVYAPTISFNTNGRYEMVEFIKNPFNTTIINIGTITGKYRTYDNKIEFTTATIESINDTTGSSPVSIVEGSYAYIYNNWNNDSILENTNAGKPLNISGYKPIIWTVVELSENTLKAIRTPGDTLVYIKY